MSGNDWLKARKPPCEGSYKPPALRMREHLRDVKVQGCCPVCGIWYGLTPQGRIPRHNAAAAKEEP